MLRSKSLPSVMSLTMQGTLQSLDPPSFFSTLAPFPGYSLELGTPQAPLCLCASCGQWDSYMEYSESGPPLSHTLLSSFLRDSPQTQGVAMGIVSWSLF